MGGEGEGGAKSTTQVPKKEATGPHAVSSHHCCRICPSGGLIRYRMNEGFEQESSILVSWVRGSTWSGTLATHRE